MQTPMWNQMLIFVLQNLVSLFLIALLLRLYIQWLRAPIKNPFVQFVYRLTNFVIVPLKSATPRGWSIIPVAVLLAFVVEFAATLIEYALLDFPFTVAGMTVLPAFAVLALAGLLTLTSHIVMGLVFVTALLSMVDPFSSLAASLAVLTAPLLRPVRQIVPVTGNIDWSPMIVLILCQLIDMFPLAWLAQWARQMM